MGASGGKMKTAALALGILAAGAATGAHGAGSRGGFNYGGPGCPAGTASASLDGSTLNVRFSAFRVAAGGATGKRFDRKACSFAVPVAVPPGRSVAVVSTAYRGAANLPAGARAQLRVENFFAGRTGPVATRSFTGSSSGAFSFSVPGRPSAWSACGQDVILRGNSSLRVSTTGSKAAALSIRTQDVRNALVYRLKWRSC